MVLFFVSFVGSSKETYYKNAGIFTPSFVRFFDIRWSGTPATGLTLGLEFESDRRNNCIILYISNLYRSYSRYETQRPKKEITRAYAWFHHVTNSRLLPTQGRSKRSGWSGHDRTNNRGGNFFSGRKNNRASHFDFRIIFKYRTILGSVCPSRNR